MSVAVRDTLELPIFKDAKILAGHRGLDNQITRVNFIEMPSNPKADQSLTKPGEFKITGFFAYRNNVDKLMGEFESLVKEKSSGICLIDEYFQVLPDDVIEYADRHGLPIILTSKSVSYADIIMEVMELIINSKDEKIYEGIVNNILNPHNTKADIRRFALDINYSFNEYIVSVFFATKDKKKINKSFLKPILNNKAQWSAIKYNEGVLMILSFKKTTEKKIQENVQSVIDTIKRNLSEYSIGVSDSYSSLGMLDNSINEALLAYNFVENLNQDVVFYDELGVYKLLFQLKADMRLKKFRDEIILPIKDYEIKNDIVLIDTAKCYLNNDGNIKTTAKQLFLHENTVRYRIEKIKEILNMKKTNITFYVQLSLALKADEILGQD